jgi:hypothetical protein
MIKLNTKDFLLINKKTSKINQISNFFKNLCFVFTMLCIIIIITVRFHYNLIIQCVTELTGKMKKLKNISITFIL